MLVGVREGETPVAFAAFDPSFPGVYPLRVARTELAGLLFAALRPWATKDALHVFVEGDDALAGLLASVGAQVRDELFRMGGALGAGVTSSNEPAR